MLSRTRELTSEFFLSVNSFHSGAKLCVTPKKIDTTQNDLNINIVSLISCLPDEIFTKMVRVVFFPLERPMNLLNPPRLIQLNQQQGLALNILIKKFASTTNVSGGIEGKQIVE